MAEPSAFVGYPHLQRQAGKLRAAAAGRDVNSLPDPRTYAFVSGLLGEPVEEQGFSVMHPDRAGIRKAADAGYLGGLLAMAAPATKAVKPVAQALAPKAADMAENYMARQGMIQPITVWHGSPHGPFAKFNPTKIGTGEGAASYGVGHYTAEARPVAERYAEILAKSKSRSLVDRSGKALDVSGTTPESFASVYLADAGADYDKARGLISILKDTAIDDQTAGFYNQAIDALGNFKARGVGLGPEVKPHLYKIDLADQVVPKLLDWDAPLGGQGREVQSLAERLGLAADDLGGDLLARVGKTREGSEAMRQAGIPGIRYLDQGSRGQGKGTSNFVVFPGNEDMLRILEINGQPLPGLLD